MTSSNYIGRFAPSPTGPLHLGSLVAAVGSYLCARKVGGQWLLRMEDLDPPREAPGAADDIRATLESHGLEWDGTVLYQSSRLEAYQAALERLIKRGQAYPCRCSRKQVVNQGQTGPFGIIYSGVCRSNTSLQGETSQHAAWRIRTHNQPIHFRDQRCGDYQQRLESEVGDFVIKRADGHFAYQLAVVVDDAHQGVTEVVRGEDLLDNTPRQIYLQRQLGYQTPDYRHLPLVTNSAGQKLSKQTFATPLATARASSNLCHALKYLGIEAPQELADASPAEILCWALEENPVTRQEDCRV